MLRLVATFATLLTVSAGITLLAQTPQPAALPSFQTVSIVPSTGGLIDIQFSPRNFVARTSTVIELIEQAYGVKPWTVFGGPEWVRVDRFTVRATSSTDAARERMKLMLQGLLAERFQLQLAPGTQTVPLYRLIAGNVRNLKSATNPNRPAVISLKEIDADTQRWEARNATMGRLAVAIAQHLKAPVVDDTKLTGAFDFRFDFAQDDGFANLESELTDGRTMLTALEKQLGLRLVGDKGPVPGHTIRRVSKPF